ncbi:MAG: tetratricopeptide repeat protein [Nitrospirae bacterium]|nr:tetratricopeptide repeat protein [Nitrospirota bacterium]
MVRQAHHDTSVTLSLSKGTPLLVALFFATHPIHSEAVVWIKNRAELFSTFFLLSSLILFMKSQILNQSSKYYSLFTIHYSLSLVCFILALLSNETAITLPAVLVFYSFFFLFPDNLSLLRTTTSPTGIVVSPHESVVRGLQEKRKKIFLMTLPFWTLGILYAVLRFTLFKEGIWSPPLDLSSHVLLVIKTIGEYLKLLTFPVNLLAERFSGIPKSILELDMLIFAMVIILLLVSGALLIRHAKPVSRTIGFTLFWIFITILPVGNIYYLNTRPIAEQRLYLSSVGFCIFLGLILGIFLKKDTEPIPGTAGTGALMTEVLTKRNSKRISRVLCVLAAFGILVPYSAGTIRRTVDWQNPLGFWEKTAKNNPNHWRTQMNLGLAYMYEDRIEDGIQRLKQAIRLAPEVPRAYFDVGFAYEMQGKIDEATAMFEKGISLTSCRDDLHSRFRAALPEIREIDLKNTDFILGCFYQKRGLKKKAITYYKKALDINPKHGETHYNLAQIYENEREYNQAIFHYDKVIEVDPGHRKIDNVYYNIGKICYFNGEPDRAITYWEKAVKIKSDLFELRTDLAGLYKEKGMYSDAIGQYKKALEISPKNWNIYFNIGLLYMKQGLYKEASAYYEKAVKYNPNFFDAHYQLGLLYLKLGHFNDAAKLFQRILYLDPTNVQAKKMYESALKSVEHAGKDR